MIKDTITLALNGEVSLAEFSQAIKGLGSLVEALQQDLHGDTNIEWVVAGLEVGSAQATIQGVGDATSIEKIIRAYEETGQKVRENRWSELSPPVVSSVKEIIKVINGRVRSVTMETSDRDIEILSDQKDSMPKPEPPAAYRGSVRGRVQSLTNRHSLRFTLYDTAKDHPVSCYLQDNMEETMRSTWGKLAIVEGLVRRDPLTGNPTTIRNIARVEIVEKSSGTWREAVGAIRWKPTDPLPEDLIRQSREP